jgi:NTP pyrophosphatase (non-canonical NTP hydrolase)
MEISALQQIVRDRYYANDSARGLFHTAMWFHEEVGELSSALARGDKANAREEFADVLMWLMTLANLMEVDMEEVVQEYLVNPRKKVASK